MRGLGKVRDKDVEEKFLSQIPDILWFQGENSKIWHRQSLGNAGKKRTCANLRQLEREVTELNERETSALFWLHHAFIYWEISILERLVNM